MSNLTLFAMGLVIALPAGIVVVALLRAAVADGKAGNVS